MLVGGVAALVLVLVAGVLAWNFWPRPVAPVTFPELQGVYAGMVRSDGTNDAAPMLRRNASPRAVDVSPAECVPLFDATVYNRFPPDALDGMGTYWLGRQETASMFTMRFVDARTAARAYRRVTDALASCADQPVRFAERRAATVRPRRITVTDASGIKAQTAYSYSTAPSSTFAVHVLQFENIVTWQFRYNSTGNEYSPLSAQQLMDALMLQTRSVIDLRE